MLQRSNIISSEEELQDFYGQLQAQHVTPAWISGGVSVEPKSKAVPYHSTLYGFPSAVSGAKKQASPTIPLSFWRH